MKMTADQLLKIAGIASTTTLRARLNESANPDITKVDYTYQIRINAADADVSHPNGDESRTSYGDTFKQQLRSGEISATHMTQIDYDNIQKVLDFLIEEGGKDFDDDEQEYEGDEKVLFDRAREEHNRLFGPGVKATFHVGFDS